MHRPPGFICNNPPSSLSVPVGYYVYHNKEGHRPGRHPKIEHDIIDAKLRRMQEAREYGEEYDELVRRLDDLWAEYQEQCEVAGR